MRMDSSHKKILAQTVASLRPPNRSWMVTHSRARIALPMERLGNAFQISRLTEASIIARIRRASYSISLKMRKMRQAIHRKELP